MARRAILAVVIGRGAGPPPGFRCDAEKRISIRPESRRESGAPEEIRTPDPQIRSLVLYPAELRVRTAANGEGGSLPHGCRGGKSRIDCFTSDFAAGASGVSFDALKRQGAAPT